MLYNYASKILAGLLDPIALAILLGAAVLLAWKHRRLAFRLLLACVLLLAVLSSSVVADALLHSLEDQYRDVGIDRVPAAQAIVVLGGTLQAPSGQHRLSALIDSSDRLLVAFRLFRAGKAPLVLCSGGNNPIFSDPADLPEGAWMGRLLEEWGAPSAAVVPVEGASINTRENAVMSYRLLAPRNLRRIILVTSALHMPRAAAAFRKVGFEVVAAPADFRTGWAEQKLPLRWIPDSSNLRRTQSALREWIGMWVYRMRGWA